ncbi:MAG TPA: ABC transporter permease [Gemmatimonadales bacterium]|nr:ABC transporter permease [Gemmatimonadales bacterium]
MNDLRLALRTLAKSPGFTAVAVLTLAMGIGPNTAIFSLIYAVLLRPLPYPESHRLVGLSETYQGNRGELDVTYSEFRYLEDHSGVFEALAVSTNVGFSVYTGDVAERVDGLRVSREYFATLGTGPALGREFLAEEDQEGGVSVVILSHGYWKRRFGGDAGVVGRVIALDGRPTTIVGVMPASFRWLSPVDAWSTMGQVARSIGGGENLHFVGRLKPGLAFEQAQERMQRVFAGFRQGFKTRLPAEVSEELFPLRRLVVGSIATPVRLLFGAIALVLLIACANVANLVLGRATTRGRELAVRAAIGATRGRLVQQMLTESVLLALAGGLVGLVLAAWGLDALVSLMPASLTPPTEIRLDRWALLFTGVASLLVGVVFGLAPAWQAATADLHAGLKDGAGRATSTGRTGRLRNALVVGEIALSLVLLVGAGLLLRTVANLLRTDPGFDRHRMIAAELWLTGTRYDSTSAIAGFYDRLEERVRALPGVRSAAVIEAGIPLVRGGNLGVGVGGKGLWATINYRTVTPRYFQTMAIPLQRGRAFAAGDVQSAEPVAIVSESFARRFLEDDALDRTVAVGGARTERRVVGVVGDTKQFIGAPASPTVFIPSAQTPAGLTRLFSSWFPIHLVVRTDGDPAALKAMVARTIRGTDAQVPLGRVRTMDEVLDGSIEFQRFVMLLLGTFAGLAVTLAAVGTYGVMSYLVAQSTREIGVRIALGALPRQVLGVVIGRGMLLAGIGAAVGLASALALTRLLAQQLYGVKATDALTFAAVTALLLLVALVACFVPARRATRVDPMVALRTE